MDFKKKVLFILPTLGKGGAEKIIIDFLNHLDINSEIDLLIIFNTNDSDFLTKNLKKKPYHLFKKKTQLYSFRFYLKKLFFLILFPFYATVIFFKFKIYNYVLIVYNLSIIGLLSYFFRFFTFFSKSKTRHVEIFHSNLHLFNFFIRFVFFFSFLNKDVIISNISSFEQIRIRKYLFWKKIIFIPFSVYIEKSLNHKKPFYDANKPIKISTLSRLVKEKHLDFYIKVCNKLRLYGYNIIFDIYGDGPERSKLHKLVRSLNLESNVYLKGLTSSPMEVLTQYHFYFSTMVGDSTGIAGIQASYFKLPILGYQTIKDYESSAGEIFSSNNIEVFTNEFIRLIGDKEKNEYVTKIIQNYYNDHSFNEFIRKYSLLFNDILVNKVKANYE
jgi:glycosyltransferase involved in cell wall biosynthesis